MSANAQTEGGVRRVLPADVFDAMDLGALAVRGIGQGAFFVRSCPVCAVGIGVFVTDSNSTDNEVVTALRLAGIGLFQNDEAVQRINSRLGRSPRARASFPDWCTELGVERGA